MNTGKIFPDSENVYQDEAKILFNYYRQAAEKIVDEEERIESQIQDLEEEKRAVEMKISKLWYWFLTIILFFVYFIQKKSCERQIEDLDERIDSLRLEHERIFRDYAVTRLGVAYIPVAQQIKYDDKSFIVDYTGGVADSEITLSQPRQNDLLIETIGRLESLASSAPVVESSAESETVETDDYSLSIQEVTQNDYLGDLDRSLRTIAFCMDDLDTTSVSLPLVLDDSERLSQLHDFGTVDPPAQAPVLQVFDSQQYVSGIHRFQEINRLKDSLSSESQQFEDVLKSLIVTIAGSVQAVSALKMASVDKVVLESNKLLYNILKAPYNHYSPMLEFDEIERIRHEKFDFSEDVQGYEPFNLRPSSRVRFNLVSGAWTAEDGSVTSMPFGVHQLYEEIVAPVVQNLMAENRIERLKIYNHIKDQKLSYLNKWHQDTDAFYRANRAESADIINLMQESLREYVAAYNTLVALQRTEDSMANSGSLDATVVTSVDNAAQSLAAFEMQSVEFQRVQNDFEEYMDRLKEDIDIKAERFGHVEYYDAKLRDGYSNEVAAASTEIHDMDERRRDLAVVNPLFAKNSQLPPQPSVADITFEHISLNLPSIARNALQELTDDIQAPEAPPVSEDSVTQDTETVTQDDDNTDTVVPEIPEASAAEFGDSADEPVDDACTPPSVPPMVPPVPNNE
ncbi:MAG: hypothetical protein K2I52_06215 [Muribaculaceae bacterium]|nr:hypothetical protein [Muribaculaceae bacterium]